MQDTMFTYKTQYLFNMNDCTIAAAIPTEGNATVLGLEIKKTFYEGLLLKLAALTIYRSE
jgi:hypothetical protein